LFDLSVIIPLAGVGVGFEFQTVNLKGEADHVIPFPINLCKCEPQTVSIIYQGKAENVRFTMKEHR
jgi:hypothetical protein